MSVEAITGLSGLAKPSCNAKEPNPSSVSSKFKIAVSYSIIFEGKVIVQEFCCMSEPYRMEEITSCVHKIEQESRKPSALALIL